MNMIVRYLRGVGIGLAFLLLAIVGLIILGIVHLAAEIGMLILTIVLIIIAIILLPHYLGEKKNGRSSGYSLKKVKK